MVKFLVTSNEAGIAVMSKQENNRAIDDSFTNSPFTPFQTFCCKHIIPMSYRIASEKESELEVITRPC